MLVGGKKGVKSVVALTATFALLPVSSSSRCCCTASSPIVAAVITSTIKVSR